MARKSRKLPSLDLSKYNTSERLPANIVSIIKNAICVYEGNTAKIAKLYNIDKEKVDYIFEEYYLQLTQIIDSQVKSKELDTGISNAILLITDHINTLQNSKSTDLMTKATINDVTRMTDRMISLKQQFNNTYDTLVNKMQEQSLRSRQVEVLENGKPEDFSDYNENLETVYTKLKTVARRIKASNIRTKEVRRYGTLREAGNAFGINPDYIRTKISTKTLYKDEWCFENDED